MNHQPYTAIYDGLSSREIEIFRLILSGKTNKEMAISLGITERTVEYHLTNIYRKLGVKSKIAAALLAKECNFN